MKTGYEEMKALAAATREAKEIVCRAMRDAYKVVDSDSVGDWFVEFCTGAERLIGAAEWEMMKMDSAPEKEKEG